MMKHLPLTPCSLLTTALALAVAVVLAVAAAGGTYALWNTQTSVPGGMISTGSAELTVTGATGMSLARLYPGQTTTGELAVTNTGSVALRLRVDALTSTAATAGGAGQAFAGALRASLWPRTGTGCPATAPAGSWSGAVGSPAADLGLTLAPGSTQPLCWAVTLSETAPPQAQGGSVALELALGGLQQ